MRQGNNVSCPILSKSGEIGGKNWAWDREAKRICPNRSKSRGVGGKNWAWDREAKRICPIRSKSGEVSESV